MFCPRCGSVMVPTRREGSVYLKCSKCGYEVKSQESRKYDIRHQVEPSKRVLTAVTSEAREAKLTPEEREMLRESTRSSSRSLSGVRARNQSQTRINYEKTTLVTT